MDALLSTVDNAAGELPTLLEVWVLVMLGVARMGGGLACTSGVLPEAPKVVHPLSIAFVF